MQENSYNRSVHLFRRDLRLEDNTALLEACRQSEEVIPVFCFDPRQAKPQENDYFSEPAFRFLCQALLDIDDKLKDHDSKLHILEGQPHEELQKLFAEKDIDALFFNNDYTPFARERDTAMQKVCEEAGVDCQRFHDVALTTPGEVLTNAGDPYRVFTPFEKKARETTPRKPRGLSADGSALSRLRAENISGSSIVSERMPEDGGEIIQTGSRSEATAILNRVGDFSDYEDTRNTPAIRGTTRLSAHLSAGTISPREVYWVVRSALGENSQLLSELYWRDFYLHISWHFPDVFGDNFSDQFDELQWRESKADFTKWQEGKTGFPIVDAGMRELKGSGWMHNRVRMIVASFLTKDLQIDWRWGEKHFAKHLVDYDPSSNNGGWQWAASTGADAQPYFRIFNPWSQGREHDPEAEYIKKWVPELQDLSAEEIHAIEDDGVPEGIQYPEAMVDHSEMYHKTKEWFKEAKRG